MYKDFFLSLCVSSLSKITLKEANFKKVNKSVRNTGLACYSFLFPPLKPVQSLSRLYMAQICPFVHIKSHPKNGVISSFHWNQYITLSVSPLHYIQILCRYLQSRKNFWYIIPEQLAANYFFYASTTSSATSHSLSPRQELVRKQITEDFYNILPSAMLLQGPNRKP